MFLPLLFSFLIWFVKSEEVNLRKRKSFTFVTSQNKEFTLQPAKNYLKKNENIFSRLSRRLRGVNMNEEGSWYYIHFIDDEGNEVRRVVNRLQLKVENGILKNTYIAYLREEELESLEEHALVKKVTPEEKFEESGGKITDTNYFHVIATEDTKIPSKHELFSIERQDDSRTYIIRVEEEGGNDKTLTEKKRQAIRFLSEISGVRSISTFTRPTIKNNIMTGYTQRNGRNFLKNNSNGLYYSERYVNNKGITGTGQIITIQDTPIDFYHAMFRDDSVQVELNTKLTNHRKFVYYGSKSTNINDWSSKLEENEHGTHVAGTTAGKSNCQNDLNVGTELFNGNAPDAKILYAGGLNDVSSSQLGSLMKQHDSYISTNSWGVDGYNDQINYEYGNLALKNPDRLFLFAAGNEYSDGNFTVCDPGGSKNVLTVGAMDDFFNTIHTYEVQSAMSSSISFKARALLDADPWIVGSIGTSTSSTVVAIDCTNGDQCTTINSGKVSLLYSSNSQSCSWVYQCQLSSTSGILYTDSVSTVNNLLSSRGNVRVTDITSFNITSPIGHADYSSGGPGNKGILKPDIMTPGTRIISAKSRNKGKSNHGCDTVNGGDFTIMQGTSMATPNAAGATALVRQYFSSERWPSSVNLDGATLRALMINSCRHPHSSKTPDILFGHGIVDLSTILPLENDFGVQITNPNSLPSIPENSAYVASLIVNSNSKPVQITLSYLDQMLDRSSAIPLTRDLDLVVVTPAGKMIKGDHLSNGDTQHFSTNEKVIIDKSDLTKGTYSIYVITGEFADSGVSTDANQKFAVVATGDISNGFLNFQRSNRCPCAQCSQANPALCQCTEGYIGTICQAQVKIVNGTKGSFSVPAMNIFRVKFNSDKNIKVIKAKSSKAGSIANIWYSQECHVNIGDYDKSGSAGTLMKKEIKVDPSMKSICVAIVNANYQEANFEIELSDKSGYTNIIIGVVVAVVVIIVIVVVIYCCYKKGKCSKIPICNSS